MLSCARQTIYRAMSSSTVSGVSCAEVTIPVPWGNIAAKKWTNSDVKPESKGELYDNDTHCKMND